MDRQEKKIIDLYIYSKFSEVQIAKELDINPSRVRWVLKKNSVKKRTISEAIRYLHITKFNKKEFTVPDFLTPEQEKLKVAGTMLYWGEGTKSGGNVALANSDPAMVAFFVRFLREICGVDNDRIHAVLHYYSDHNEKKLKQFWSETINLPLTQFYQSHLHLNTKGSYKKKSQYGTLSVQYCDKQLLELIKSWVAEYSVIGLRRPSSVGRATHL